MEPWRTFWSCERDHGKASRTITHKIKKELSVCQTKLAEARIENLITTEKGKVTEISHGARVEIHVTQISCSSRAMRSRFRTYTDKGRERSLMRTNFV